MEGKACQVSGVRCQVTAKAGDGLGEAFERLYDEALVAAGRWDEREEIGEVVSELMCGEEGEMGRQTRLDLQCALRMAIARALFVLQKRRGLRVVDVVGRNGVSGEGDGVSGEGEGDGVSGVR